MPKRKPARAKESKPAAKAKKKAALRKQSAGARKRAASKKPVRRKRAVRARGRVTAAGEITLPVRPGFGPTSAGQSGDIEGLPATPGANSESVEELAAEGQDFEAEVIDAVEGAPDPDESEVKTREVMENDVPEEYEDDEKPGRFTR